MKEQIKKIIESEFDSDIKSREIIQLINKMIMAKAKETLYGNDLTGHKAVISLFIDM